MMGVAGSGNMYGMAGGTRVPPGYQQMPQGQGRGGQGAVPGMGRGAMMAPNGAPIQRGAAAAHMQQQRGAQPG